MIFRIGVITNNLTFKSHLSLALCNNSLLDKCIYLLIEYLHPWFNSCGRQGLGIVQVVQIMYSIVDISLVVIQMGQIVQITQLAMQQKNGKVLQLSMSINFAGICHTCKGRIYRVQY